MYKFNTMDSQPEEWLQDDAAVLHTLCFCCFHDSASAKKWIHQLVPKNQIGVLQKWSGGARRDGNLRRRREFIEAINWHYSDIDFSVHCISATEAEISKFAQAFYWQNLNNIRQELDDKNRNCLVFKINEAKEIKIPVLRAAILIWIYYSIKYMKDENNLNGFIYSDWFSADKQTGEDKALGVAMVNFLLKRTGLELELKLPLDPASAEADLLSDWFAGWCNSSKAGTVEAEIKEEFEKVLDRSPKKIDWIMYGVEVTFTPAG